MLEQDAQIVTLTEVFLTRHDEEVVFDWFAYLFEREYPGCEIEYKYLEVEKAGHVAFNGKMCERWVGQTIVVAKGSTVGGQTITTQKNAAEELV